MTLVVFGGGYWGHHHVSGLLKAKAAGRASFDSLVVVDRLAEHAVRTAFGDRPDVAIVVQEWDDFLDDYMDRAMRGREDRLVPAPVAPHLFMTWLQRSLARLRPDFAWETRALEEPLATPFEATGSQGERFVSFAEWMCPPNCIEPRRCPAIKAERTWEMPETMARYGEALGVVETAVFHSKHYAWGIAALPSQALEDARARILESLPVSGGDYLIATVSSCHGVAGMISARPIPTRPER
ncbi:hypothetical protein J7643_03100 [bacterium]|nr:hypothetical protein [bacterium]